MAKVSNLWKKFVNIGYKKHLTFALAIRLILIAYGIHHDQISEIKYTDIDYKVFTDASRHLINGNSPYDRHTYRYSPLVAILLIPNLLVHHSFGKILFSVIDIVAALLIRALVSHLLNEYERYREKENIVEKTLKIKEKIEFVKLENKKRKKERTKNGKTWDGIKPKNESKNPMEVTSDIAMICWLYNPLTIAIGTRGNCDSIAGTLVLLTLYYLQCQQKFFTAGVIHGISIHFRLYPIIYSLTIFMYLSRFSFYSIDRRNCKNDSRSILTKSNTKQIKNVENTIIQQSQNGDDKVISFSGHLREKKTIFKKKYLLYLIPNFDQLRVILGCLLSLSCLTFVFYNVFGYKFLYETYIYHFTRKDTRHSFSLYFYLLYLTAWVKNIGIWQKGLIVLPQMVLITVFSIRYGLNKFSLNFAILLQTIVMVIYNSVLTSQYFVWIMIILPLCLWQIKMPIQKAVILLCIWFVAQAVWLLPAYLLEFRGENTFLFIWTQGVSFFCANIAILGRLIMYFQLSVHDKNV